MNNQLINIMNILQMSVL